MEARTSLQLTSKNDYDSMLKENNIKVLNTLSFRLLNKFKVEEEELDQSDRLLTYNKALPKYQ